MVDEEGGQASTHRSLQKHSHSFAARGVSRGVRGTGGTEPMRVHHSRTGSYASMASKYVRV